MNTVVNARHRRIKKGEDGNVAFKVTYVDRNWSGVCSEKGYKDNLADGRIWCEPHPISWTLLKPQAACLVN